MIDQNLARFRDFLVIEFTEQQLEQLCQEIGMNYADLPGMGAYGKTREMIEAARSSNSLNSLMSRARELRPDAYQSARIAEAEGEAQGALEPTYRAVMGSGDGVEGESQSAGWLAGLKNAFTPRVRLIAIIIALLLLTVALLSIILPPPNSATAPIVPQDQQAGAIDVAATQTADALAVLETPMANPEAPADAPAAEAPAAEQPAEAPPAPAVDPAVMTVRNGNEVVIRFLNGAAAESDLANYWAGSPLKVVTDFAYTTLRRSLGINLKSGDKVDVRLEYLNEPQIVDANQDNPRLTSREYWSYTNPTTSRSICDTRDYTYTLSKNGDTYQITGLKSTLVSGKCDR